MNEFPEWFLAEWKGQSFKPVRVTEVTRQTGEPGIVITWQAQCHDCAHEYETTTGRLFRFPRRRCEKCHAEKRGVF